MDPLWHDLCADLVSACHSFNRLYRPDPKTPVMDQVHADEIEFSCQLPLKGGRRVERIELATATFTLDREALAITCCYRNSEVAPFNLSFDYENEDIFLKRADGSKIEDMNAASQLLLKAFLLGLP